MFFNEIVDFQCREASKTNLLSDSLRQTFGEVQFVRQRFWEAWLEPSCNLIVTYAPCDD